MQNVYVFGNPHREDDAVPIHLLPILAHDFPAVSFKVLDPNEEWDVPQHMLIIDTIFNLKEVTVFRDLNAFMAAPRMTCHDFDAYANLMLMKKLGKVNDAVIIGVPHGCTEAYIKEPLCSALKKELRNKY